jgi:hypothetical protein
MDGIQLLGQFQQIRPDAARILISNNPDKALLSQAINEVQIHSFLCTNESTSEPQAQVGQGSRGTYQLRTAVMQALASRDLPLESQQPATLREQL